jgi:glycosyltransferase involved in cell wall biosynthesis
VNGGGTKSLGLQGDPAAQGPSEPLVSILMPVFNAGPHVGLAVASILAQDYQNWELIVIDDGSTDTSVQRMREFSDPRIRFLVGEQNRGLPFRLNQAIRLARGGLLARMDADDLSYPQRLGRQVDHLLRHPTVDVVATDMLVMDAEGRPHGREKWRGAAHERIISRPWSGFHFNHATWLGRAGWFRRFGYREDAFRTEDDDLMLRSYRVSRFHRLDEVMYAYRVGPLSRPSIYTARRSFIRALWRQAWAGPDQRLLVGIPIQLAKAAAEWVSQSTGLEELVTRHRSDGSLPEQVALDFQAALAAIRSPRRARRGVPERVRRSGFPDADIRS